MNDRKQWLRIHGSTAYNKAVKADGLIRSVHASIRQNDRSIAIVEDMLSAAARSPIHAVPNDLERLKKQCHIHGIDVISDGIFIDCVRIDLTCCTDKVRAHIMKYIKNITISISVKTDSDVCYGATARLTPTVPKIKTRR